MDPKKRQALEAAGWRFGDAADFLGMTDEERQLLDARAEAVLAVHHRQVIETVDPVKSDDSGGC
jgi:hypothetical protein